MISKKLFEYSKQIKALAEIGLVYQKDDFDQDRYLNLKSIATEMMALLIDQPVSVIADIDLPKEEYITPKVDVRAVIFDAHDQILMVHEKVDDKWSLPGGWADIGYSPSEIAEKETAEEAGVKVSAKRLLAIMDKKNHNHPADIHYVYKVFIHCELVHQDLERGYETHDARFFPLNALPDLSTPRNTKEQIDIIFERYKNPEQYPYFD